MPKKTIKVTPIQGTYKIIYNNIEYIIENTAQLRNFLKLNRIDQDILTNPQKYNATVMQIKI